MTLMSKLNPKLAYLYTSAKVAAIRNRLHAQRALRKGQPALARLFAALESSESAQMRRFLMYLRGKVGDSDTYLNAYLDAKRDEIAPLYAEMVTYYETAGLKGKVENFLQFEKVVRAQTHLIGRFQKENADRSGDVYVCQVCGFITTIKPSANCPVCNAVKEKFERFE
jgi:rubrerythrin